jgi:hypothetical protein
MEEDTLNTMYNTLTIKKKGEVFRRLLDSKEFYAIWGEFDKNTTDAFIEDFFGTMDVQRLITGLPISNDDVKIIHDEFIKAIEYVNSPHTPPVRSRVGTPVGSNNENENENENNGHMSDGSFRKEKSRKSRKNRKAKSRKAPKARKATRRK